MALDLTPEQKATGKANFEQAAGDLARAGKMNTMVVGGAADPKKPDRRDFLKTGLAVGAVIPVSAAVYYGYHSWTGNKAVRTALIGCGDEGGVLVGAPCSPLGVVHADDLDGSGQARVGGRVDNHRLEVPAAGHTMTKALWTLGMRSMHPATLFTVSTRMMSIRAIASHRPLTAL